MQKEYSQPKYNKLEFTCSHCNKLVLHESWSWQISTFAKVTQVTNNSTIYDIQQKYINNSDDELYKPKAFIKSFISKSYDPLYKKNIGSIEFITRICSNCGNRSYWELIKYFKETKDNKNDSHFPIDHEDEVKIFPIKSSIQWIPNDDMTDEQKNLFNEAKNIFDNSPKAAGALLRSVIENILRKKYDKHKSSLLGSILNDKDVEKDLGGKIMQMCKTCQLIGNDAAHSSLMIYLDENKEEVKFLFELINLIAEQLVSKPKKEQELLQKCESINLQKQKQKQN